MKSEHYLSGILSQLNTPRHSHKNLQRKLNLTDLRNITNDTTNSLTNAINGDQWKLKSTPRRNSFGNSDKDSVSSASTVRSKRIKTRQEIIINGLI